MRFPIPISAFRAPALALLLTAFALGSDSPRFRGPNGAGVFEGADLPTEIGPDTNVTWKIAVPKGKSSPIIAGNRLFLTAYEGDQRLVLCFDRASGRELWRRQVPADREDKQHQLNDSASPSPLTDGANVHAFFSEYGLVSYGPDGEKRWQVPLGPFASPFGLGASPILVDGKIVLVADQTKGSYIAAFDPANGEMLWKTPRPDDAGAYSTPAVFPSPRGDEIVLTGQRELASYSAGTGERLWWVNGFAKLSKGSPIVHEGIVYANVRGVGEFIAPFDEWAKRKDVDHDGRVTVAEAADEAGRKSLEKLETSGDGVVSRAEYRAPLEAEAIAGGVWAVRAGGRGEVSANVLWKYQKSLPNVPSPLFYKNVLYLVKNGGIVTSLDPVSGKVYKQGRLRDALEHYYASPIAADGKIYAVSERGKVVVIQAGPQWQVLSTNDLAEDTYATPVVAGNRLYLRTMSTLYCFANPHD